MSSPDPDGHLPAPQDQSGEADDAPRIRDIAIQQSFHQIQLLFPSLIDAMARLAEHQPELAHKIVDDVISQGEHRQTLEGLVIRGDDRRATRAQVLSWIFAMTALLGSLALINSGQSTAGIVIVVTALAPLVGVNVLGRRAAKRERVAKLNLAHRVPDSDDQND